MSINFNCIYFTNLESSLFLTEKSPRSSLNYKLSYTLSFSPIGKHKRPRERLDEYQRVSLLRFMKPFDRSRVDMWADIYAVQLYIICQ